MAVAVANLTSGEGQDTGTPFTGVTTAVNTVEGRGYFLAIGCDDTTTTDVVTVSSISTAGGVTWSLIDRAVADASNGRNLELWYGVCTATTASVQWTITFTAVGDATYAYFIDEVTGSTGTLVQSGKSANDSSSPVTVSLLTSADLNNGTYAAALNDATGGTGTLTVASGWTEKDRPRTPPRTTSPSRAGTKPPQISGLILLDLERATTTP